jgi:large subunit ribosomal protein L1
MRCYAVLIPFSSLAAKSLNEANNEINIRYIRAFEVGYPASSPKYEAHIRLRTLRDGPVIRNRVTLPHPVRSDMRIAAILDPDSPEAAEARAAGAIIVGSAEQVLGPLVAAQKQPVGKKGGKKPKEDTKDEKESESDGQTAEAAVEPAKTKIDFDRLVVHPTLMPAVTKLPGIARILGPKGLMPSLKTGTVTPHVVQFVKDATSSVEYREKIGVIRLSVGQLGFTPDQVRENIQAVVKQLKKDATDLVERSEGVGLNASKKDVEEVVLSSTHGPGFSLNGEFRSIDGIAPEQLRAE